MGWRSVRSGEHHDPVGVRARGPCGVGAPRTLLHSTGGPHLTLSIAVALPGRPALELFASAGKNVPTGVGYSLLLVAHLASAVVGFGALGLTGFEASKARGGPASENAESVRRYFRPGVNWAARTLYLVPIFGFALLADSNGVFGASDIFVVVGLCIWAASTAVAELVVWPAERRIQRAVTDGWGPSSEAEVGGKRDPDPLKLDPALKRDCDRIVVVTWILAAGFLAAVVVMIGKP
jgi:uncharacterized membrane protein